MMDESSDDFVLGKWVRSQLEKGDSPEILRTTLKNRGMNPDIVDAVLASFKKKQLPKKEDPIKENKPEKEHSNNMYNKGLKREIDMILSSSEPEKEKVTTQEFPGIEKGKYLRKKKYNDIKNDAVREKPDESHSIPKKTAHISHKETVIREESLFSLFIKKMSESFSRIKIPNMSSVFFDSRVVIWSAIAVAIVLILLFASYGLDWYADRMASRVLD